MNFFPHYIEPLGDHALIIRFVDLINDSVHQQILFLFQQLQKQPVTGMLDLIPAYTSLAVVYDVMVVNKEAPAFSAYQYIKKQVENLMEKSDWSFELRKRIIRIPVCYDSSFGIDLEEMAAQKRMSTDKIVRLHTETSYHVYMIGFLPGFAYMGIVDAQIAMPRKNSPRQKVPAGSVGIAGKQTGVYPFDSPGGWNIIGKTPLQMFNKNSKEPCLLQPGDEIIFEPVSLQEFENIKNS
ncbi:MAG TPA: 5-oxoprolinase subunit PxpB [Chitinophagaceae bacterium]|nr:5-oxoprolinase subunit PxpB [Chitinophagaceae bacterium]